MPAVFDPTFAPVTSVVSTANSSTVTLAGGAAFTGTSENVQDYASIEVSVFADQVSAALGLSVQQSSNGTNWDLLDQYTIPASTGKTFSFAPAARFYRVVYTNGATIQTAFRLMTVYHYSLTRSSTHSLADTITQQNDAELVIAQIRGNNGTNIVPILVDAAGNIITKAFVNANGSIVNTALVATTASSVSAPANAVGFIFEAPSSNTDNIRWCVGGTASTTTGMLCEPGRDSGYVPVGANISVCATASGTNAFSVQWILSA